MSSTPQAVGGNWVIGALLAELSAVLTTLGYVFTRRAFTSKGIEVSKLLECFLRGMGYLTQVVYVYIYIYSGVKVLGSVSGT